MTSIVYRELEAKNKTDTNFDAYRNIHHGNISVPLKTLIKKKVSQDLVLNLLKVIFLILCSRIIVFNNCQLK